MILHVVGDILARSAGKILGHARQLGAGKPDLVRELLRAHRRAADFVERVANRGELTHILAAPERVGVAPEVLRRSRGRRAGRRNAHQRALFDGGGRGPRAPIPWMRPL